MVTRISVRVYPREERTIVTSTVDLFEGESAEKDEVWETLFEGDIVSKRAKFTRVDGSQRSHDKLQIQSKYSTERPNQSVLLRDEDDEASLSKISDLIVAARHVEKSGDYIVINVTDFDPDDTEWLLDTVLKDRSKLKLLPLVSEFVSDEKSAAELRQLFSDHPNRALRFSVALNYERLSRVLEEFKRRVVEGCGICQKCIEGGRCPEQEYQRFLEENYWILGSEYSQMLERELIWKGKQDFNMRRTADDYLEVIEIKTPEVVLFKEVKNRFIEKEEVVNAINQVDDYHKRIEDNWRALSRKYPDLRLDKVRGKVVIGGRKDLSEEEKTALRRLNARLHGIEVITFAQLIASAERMLKILGEQRTADIEKEHDEQINTPPNADDADSHETEHNYWDPPESVDDIPF